MSPKKPHPLIYKIARSAHPLSENPFLPDIVSSSEKAGERSAVIYTLVANCRIHSVEPYTYLKDVLERLPSATNQTVAQLTPLNWKKARPTALKLAP